MYICWILFYFVGFGCCCWCISFRLLLACCSLFQILCTRTSNMEHITSRPNIRIFLNLEYVYIHTHTHQLLPCDAQGSTISEKFEILGSFWNKLDTKNTNDGAKQERKNEEKKNNHLNEYKCLNTKRIKNMKKKKYQRLEYPVFQYPYTIHTFNCPKSNESKSEYLE